MVARPMKPKITLVDCDVSSATVLWTVSTSLNFRHTPAFQQETLQLSKENEGFLNCSYEKIETNLSSVYNYRPFYTIQIQNGGHQCTWFFSLRQSCMQHNRKTFCKYILTCLKHVAETNLI